LGPPPVDSTEGIALNISAISGHVDRILAIRLRSGSHSYYDDCNQVLQSAISILTMVYGPTSPQLAAVNALQDESPITRGRAALAPWPT